MLQRSSAFRRISIKLLHVMFFSIDLIQPASYNQSRYSRINRHKGEIQCAWQCVICDMTDTMGEPHPQLSPLKMSFRCLHKVLSIGLDCRKI